MTKRSRAKQRKQRFRAKRRAELADAEVAGAEVAGAEVAGAEVAGAPAAAAPDDIASRLRARLSALRWRPSRGEAHAVILGLAIQSVVGLAMLLFAWNYAALAETFHSLHAHFPHALPLWYHDAYTEEEISSWLLPLANWDGNHYLTLSKVFHVEGDPGFERFYPLYPFLIRIFSLVFPAPVSALLLNYLFIAAFCAFLYRICAHYGCRWPALAVLVVMAFPTAFFTAAFYSEPLFLFLTAAFFYHFFCTRRRVYLVYFALMPLSRGGAIFLFGGLMLYGLLEFARFLAARRGGRTAPVSFAWRPYAECAAVFVLGAAAYLAFFQIVAGDLFAGLTSHARTDPARHHSIANLLNPGHFWHLMGGEWLHFNLFVWSISHFEYWMVWATLAASLVFVAFREWRLLCFYFPLIYCQAAMGYFSGFPRYALTAMPFLALALAKHTRTRGSAAVIYALCVASFAVQFYLAARFSLNIWVA